MSCLDNQMEKIISWADLFLNDWENSAIGIDSFSFIKSKTSSKPKKTQMQKMSLA